jgi:hypothetical protein
MQYFLQGNAETGPEGVKSWFHPTRLYRIVPGETVARVGKKWSLLAGYVRIAHNRGPFLAASRNALPNEG